MTRTQLSTGSCERREANFWSGSGELNWREAGSHAKKFSWVLAGKFALMGSNAALMLFLAHRLELRTYGLLVITISGQLLLSRLLMAGTDAGMLRLTALTDLRSRSREVVTAGLVAIVCTSFALIAVSLLAAVVLSLFGVPGWILACTVAGSIGTSFVDYGYSFRLARREYPSAALAQGGTAILRMGLTSLAAGLLPAYSIPVFVAYHGASLLSGLAQALLIKVSQRWLDRALIQRLLRYSVWQGMANVIVIISLYQGTFLLMFLKQPAATGIFGLGLTLSLGFFAIYNAYSEYLLVRIRSVEGINALRRFITRALGASIFLIVGCLPLVLMVRMFLPWFLKLEVLEVVPVFSYLAASMVLLLLQAPLVAASHYLMRPQLISYGWLIRVFLIAVAGFIFAPGMGAMGAALAQLIGSALALFFLGAMVSVALRSAVDEEG